MPRKLFNIALFAFVALLVLLWQYRFAPAQTNHTGLHRALWLTGSGLALQALPQPLLVIAGRCLFGLGLFLATVRLDLLLFRLSTPERYAADFSKIYMAQSLGVLLASYCAGAVVAATGAPANFLVGCKILSGKGRGGRYFTHRIVLGQIYEENQLVSLILITN